ncbi:MAG: CHASE2 domain-containing protein [Candidatus Omnitrophota bacterium]
MKIKPFFSKTAAACVLISVMAVVMGLSYSRVFDTYELPLLDFRFRMRPPLPVDKNIVIIDICDMSISQIGSWPFPRKYHALLVRALSEAGAKQIVFDMFFSEKAPGDEEFADEIKKAGNIYMPYVFSAELGKELNCPLANEYDAELIDIFSKSCRGTGHITILPDTDGKFRRIAPYIKYKGELYPYITIRAVLDYMDMSPDDARIEPGKHVHLPDGTDIPLDIRSNIIVNFPGKWGTIFRHYAYVDILKSYIAKLEGKKGCVDLSRLKNAVCFIGYTATGMDAHASPFEALYPGVGIHASVFNSILHKIFINRARRTVNMLILVLLLILTYGASAKSRRLESVTYMSVIIGLFFLFSMALFIAFGYWIDVFYPMALMVFFYLGLTFRKYLVETQKRELLEKELSIAKNIQESFLPMAKPEVPGVDIEVKMVTAKQVGGDLYDFVHISDTKAGVMIGDVSGKGVPAALYMAKVVSEFKPFAREETTDKTLTLLNDRLVAESASSLFVTIAYIIFDLGEMKLRFSLGGHLPIIMMRQGEDKPRLLDLKVGMPLGMMECPFEEGIHDIRDGDMFVLYTDGVTEAMDVKNEMFGEEKLAELVLKNREQSAGEIVKTIHNAVSAFAGRAPQHDDITVIAVRITTGGKQDG